MISTNDVKAGMALDLDDGLYTVVEQQHVKPGKGQAFVRLKMKNVRTGAVVDRKFRAGESVQDARIDRRDFTFLYQDDMGFNVMDAETFDQMAETEPYGVPGPGRARVEIDPKEEEVGGQYLSR